MPFTVNDREAGNASRTLSSAACVTGPPDRRCAVYDRLLARQGHSAWWPGESPFEVCIGAILTQNTAWTNVERALAALRRDGLLVLRGPVARRRTRAWPS